MKLFHYIEENYIFEIKEIENLVNQECLVKKLEQFLLFFLVREGIDNTNLRQKTSH